MLTFVVCGSGFTGNWNDRWNKLDWKKRLAKDNKIDASENELCGRWAAPTILNMIHTAKNADKAERVHG